MFSLRPPANFEALQSLTRWVLLCACVGVVAGLAAIAFFWLLSLSQHVFLDLLAGYRPMEPGRVAPIFGHSSLPLNRWALFVLPALGGLLSGVLVYVFAPEAEGHGTDAVIDSYHRGRGRIRFSVPLVKGVASAVVIGTGGSAGPEGPMAQIGAGFGSVLGRMLHLSEQECRILMIAGMAAGIGAIFHAPLAAGLFAAEVLYRHMELEHEVIVPSFVSSIVAYAIFAVRFGWEPLFASPSFVFRNPMELIPYLVLALLLAGMAVVFVKVFYTVRRQFLALRIPFYWKPALGGLVVGTFGLLLPDVMGTSYGVLQQFLSGHIGGQIGWMFLLLIAVLKIFATSFSIASGGSGGLFGPIAVVGGCVGGAVGTLAQMWFPSWGVQPGAFMIVGMAGLFAAATKTPIASIMMVSEMTGDYHLLVPAMWVSILAYLLVKRSTTLYEKQVATRFDAPHHLGEMMGEVLKRLTVRNTLAREGHEPTSAVHENMPLRQLLDRFARTSYTSFAVVNEEGKYLGMVAGKHLRSLIAEQGLDALVVARDLLVRRPFVTTDETLHEAIQTFARIPDAELAVVDSKRTQQFVDILTRQDIINTYDQRIMQASDLFQ